MHGPSGAGEAVLLKKLPSSYNSYDLSVWEINGRGYVRKCFPASAERRYLTERRAYELLAESGCQCAPTILANPPRPGPRELWIEYVEGTPLDDFPSGRVSATAAAIREYHQATALPGDAAYGPVYAADRRTLPQDYWLSHVEDLERACGHHGLPAAWVQSFQSVVSAALSRDDGAECALVHRDLRPDNLLVGRDSQVRIIDWEIAAFLHPAFDLSRLFLASPFREASARSEFLQCYGRTFSGDVTRLCDAALGVQLVSYGTPDGKSRELYAQGVQLLQGAL